MHNMCPNERRHNTGTPTPLTHTDRPMARHFSRSSNQPTASQGCGWVCTVVDRFTKEIVVFPISRSISSEELACEYRDRESQHVSPQPTTHNQTDKLREPSKHGKGIYEHTLQKLTGLYSFQPWSLLITPPSTHPLESHPSTSHALTARESDLNLCQPT